MVRCGGACRSMGEGAYRPSTLGGGCQVTLSLSHPSPLHLPWLYSLPSQTPFTDAHTHWHSRPHLALSGWGMLLDSRLRALPAVPYNGSELSVRRLSAGVSVSASVLSFVG
eukprot:2407797-Rhodomonas_salina.1